MTARSRVCRVLVPLLVLAVAAPVGAWAAVQRDGSALTGSSSSAAAAAPDVANARAEAAAAAKDAANLDGVWGDLYPASPFDQVLKQPDGRSFSAKLTNAEIGGKFEVNGYTVVRGADRIWRYAAQRTKAGSLVESKAVVGVHPVPPGTPKGVGRTENVWKDENGRDMRASALRQLQIASYKAQMAAAAEGEPRLFKFPVLMLATWYDREKGQTEPQFQEGTDTPEYFRKLLDGFGGNPHGTLTEFYFEDSVGQFIVQVDVYGPYTSQRSRQDPCYYGGIEPGDDGQTDLDLIDDALGIGGGGALGMAAEAVPQADPEVDFAQYDNDGNSLVDFVGIIHSGADMAVTGDPCNTWSHAIQATLGASPFSPAGIPTSDAVFVDQLFTMPEFNSVNQPLTIGVATHEMSHALGEPDYYDTSYTSMGTGDWDLMSGGSYLGNPAGSNPSGFNPASRVFQGWMQPTIVDTDRRGIALKPRRLKPTADYKAPAPNPSLLLVPVKEIAVGEDDGTGYVWTEQDTYGMPKNPKTGKFVLEGYYVENMNRTANAPPLNDRMTRSPYFDRQLLGSGVMAWHYDYWRRSNVYFGSNNAQNDSNRPQMDVMEWDFNDNSQELQLSLSRGNAEDVMFGAATGITSGTRMMPPGVPPATGEPQKPIEFSGAAVVADSDTPFTVEKNPNNYIMTARVTGTGDCTLSLVKDGKVVGAEADSGGVGDEEVVTVVQPEPGEWIVRVGDFAGCANYSGSITFESSAASLVTKGAADTWSNWSQKPSGWAITNVGPGRYSELDHSADAGGSETIRLDIVNIGATERDLSPGFVNGEGNLNFGSAPISVGRANMMSVPVFNNGGAAISSAAVQVRRDSPTGPVVANTTVTNLGAYTRKNVKFAFTPTREGSHDLYVTVDPAGSVAEAHEGNNVQKSTVWAGPATPRVLIVDDDGAQDSELATAGALASLGVPYAILKEHPTAAQLAPYQAVIWMTGGERYQGQLDAGDRAALRPYLNNGGKLMITAPRIVDALGEDPGRTNPGGSAEGQAFLKQYFGAAFLSAAAPNNQDTPVTGTGGVLGTNKYVVSQLPGRHIIQQMKVADYTEPVSDESVPPAIGTVRPALKLEGAPEGALLGVSVQGDAAHKGFKTITLGFNLGQLSSADQYASLTRSALTYFGVPMGTYTPSAPAPIIYHPAVRSRVSGVPVDVRAFVLGASGNPTLFFRRHNKGDYYSVPMTRGASRGAWHARIPGNAVTPDGVDYYIQAGGSFDPPLARDKSVVHAIGVAIPEVPNAIAVKNGTSNTPAPVQGPLSLFTNASQITAGNSPILSGVAKTAAGEVMANTDITIMGKKYGAGQTYQRVATVKTDATGKYSLLLKGPLAPLTQTTYVAQAGGLQSINQLIRVYARINIASVRQSGRTLTFSGNMVPGYSGAPVGLAHFDADRRFSYISQGRNNSSGYWTITAQMAPGTYNFVVYTSARAGTDKGNKSLRFTVR